MTFTSDVILIPSEATPGYALVVSISTGTVVGTVSLVVSEFGAVLGNGTLGLKENVADSTFAIYDPTLTLVASVVVFSGTWNRLSPVGSDGANTFYVSKLHSATGQSQVRAVSATGVVGGTTWTVPVQNLKSITVNLTGTTLYYADEVDGAPVRRWDLINDLALPDFIAGTVTNRTRKEGLLAIPSTGDVLVVNTPGAVSPPYNWNVSRYSSAGALLKTYPITDDRVAGDEARISLDLGNPAAFWLRTNNNGSTLTRFDQIGLTTGVVIKSIELPVSGSSGDVPISCSIFTWSLPVVVGPPTPTPTPTPSGPCDCPPPGGPPSGGGGAGPAGGGPEGTEPPGNPGWNAGGINWYHSCAGAGGSAQSYPTVLPAEDFTAVREIRTWVDCRFKEYPSETVTPVELALGASHIPDPPTYEDGRKIGVVKTLSGITRSLSTETGDLIGTRVTVDIDDRRRTLRSLLADPSAKWLHGRQANIKTISEARRRTRSTPTTILRGVVRGKSLARHLQGSLVIEDRLTSEYGPLGSKRTISDRVITKGLFAGAPTQAIGKNQPIMLGVVGDWGATDPLTGLPAEKGIIPLIAVGDRGVNGSTYTEFFVAGHAIEGIDVYGQDPDDPTMRSKVPEDLYGSQVLAPGHVGWPFPTNYFDYTDSETGLVHRVTTIFITGPIADAHNLGQITVAANVCGMEASGDGTGNVLDRAFPAIQVLLDNFILRSYYTGNYLGAPQWEDGTYMTHSQSFADAQALSGTWLGDSYGYTTGMVIQDGLLSRDVLKRCAQTFHCRFGWTWAGQFMAVLPNDTVDVSTLQKFREPVQIRAGLTPDYVVDTLANPIFYNFDYDYDKQAWRNKDFVRDDTAITRMGGERPLTIDCWATRDPATAKDAMGRTLLWNKYEQETVSIAMPIGGLNRELGEVIRASSIEGVGDGYDETPFFLTDVDYDPISHRNVFSAIAMTDIAQPLPVFDTAVFDTARFA